MLRQIFAVIAGIVATSIIVGIVQYIGHMLYALPAGSNSNDPEVIRKYVETAPFMALFFVIISYAAGAVCGGFVASKIGRDSSRAPVFILGAVFVLISVYMMVAIPSPFWFWVLGMGAWGLVFVGRDLAQKRRL